VPRHRALAEVARGPRDTAGSRPRARGPPPLSLHSHSLPLPLCYVFSLKHPHASCSVFSEWIALQSPAGVNEGVLVLACNLPRRVVLGDHQGGATFPPLVSTLSSIRVEDISAGILYPIWYVHRYPSHMYNICRRTARHHTVPLLPVPTMPTLVVVLRAPSPELITPPLLRTHTCVWVCCGRNPTPSAAASCLHDAFVHLAVYRS
jgi:hypothetical protein